MPESKERKFICLGCGKELHLGEHCYQYIDMDEHYVPRDPKHRLLTPYKEITEE